MLGPAQLWGDFGGRAACSLSLCLFGSAVAAKGSPCAFTDVVFPIFNKGQDYDQFGMLQHLKKSLWAACPSTRDSPPDSGTSASDSFISSSSSMS